MSPPQVNLAVKEPPTVSDEELPMEKKEGGMDSPVIVTVDTEKIRMQRVKFQAKRRRRLACCISLVAIVLVAVSTVAVLTIRHRIHGRHHRHHRTQWKCNVGKEQLKEKVHVDYDNKLIDVQHPRSQSSPAVHILHEYGRRMTAYKDLDRNICYITRLDETFEEGYARWEGYETTGRDPKTIRVFPESRVEVLELKHILYVHIEAHCHNSNSFWAMEIDEKEVETYMKIVRL